MNFFLPSVVISFLLLTFCSQNKDQGSDQSIATHDLNKGDELSKEWEEAVETDDTTGVSWVNFQNYQQGSIYFSLVDNLRIRNAPSLKGKEIKKVGYGAMLYYSGRTRGEELSLKLRGIMRTGKWYEVTTKDGGTTGWTFAGALISDEDVIKVGPDRKYKNLQSALEATEGNTIIHIDEGKYIQDEEISVGGYVRNGVTYDVKNTLIEGKGEVKLVCSDKDANVMWIGSDDITLRNLSLYHEPKVDDGQPPYCSGNVITLDIGSNLTIEDCELNGCGRVGLYYNTGPTKVTLKNNHIFNNSFCAIIDGDGNKLFAEDPNHSHIIFENNKIEKNGNGSIEYYDRDSETYYSGDYEEEYDGH